MKVHIEKIVFNGYGLAHNGSATIFVDRVLPGEVVEVEVIKKVRGVFFASPISILSPSQHRLQPRCPYVDNCGGCDWQHIPYAQQVRIKQFLFKECLAGIGKITQIPDIEMIQSKEWEYRIRAQLHVDTTLGLMGFYKKRSNSLLKINSCPLLHKTINEVLLHQDRLIPFLPITTHQLKIIAGRNGTTTSTPLIPTISKTLADIEVGQSVFTVRGDSFFQGNTFLLNALGEWAKPFVSGNQLLDLYGGVGFFSIMLAAQFNRVMIVENRKSQIVLAQKNFLRNGINHWTTVQNRVENCLVKRKITRQKPDCVIIDPPRSGLTKTVREGIIFLQPHSIVYFSCNPSTQARDVGFFIQKGVYSIKRAAVFDLYPQTHHLETGLLLQLR